MSPYRTPSVQVPSGYIENPTRWQRIWHWIKGCRLITHLETEVYVVKRCCQCGRVVRDEVPFWDMDHDGYYLNASEAACAARVADTLASLSHLPCWSR